ncbi:MAG: hypothetical protein L0Y72_14700 [Gemmataceae bacterium]|nr:hypothetical protein [Gemmataceae bacterium]MCI0740292.1 hypothetical protein [Gemmataceae bacterium]
MTRPYLLPLGLCSVVFVASLSHGQSPPPAKETILFKADGYVYPISVAFSPDGKQIAAAVRFDVIVLDATSGKRLHTLKGHTSWVSPIAFSSDGKVLASGADDCTVRTWNLADGSERLTLKGHKDFIAGVAFSKDGKRLISTSGWKTWRPGITEDIKTWDAASGKELSSDAGGGFFMFRFTSSADGQRIAGMGGFRWRVLDLVKGDLYAQTDLAGLTLSPDGQWIAQQTKDGTIKVLDLSSPKRGSNPLPHGRGSDARGSDGEVFTNKVEKRKVLTSYLALSADKKHLAVGSVVEVPGQNEQTPAARGILRTWNISTGKLILEHTIYNDVFHCLAFSPDSRRLAFGLVGGDLRVLEIP